MRVVHTLSTLSGHGAGMFHFVNSLAKEQHRSGLDVVVLGLRDAAAPDLHLWDPVETALVDTAGFSFFPVAAGYGRVLEQLAPDVVHTHGLWSYHSLGVRRYCREQGVPHVASPHGMLEPWAWKHHAWKKKPVWFLWEERFLTGASLLHAHSHMEVAGLRQRGLAKPIAIVPCGVAVDAAAAAARARGTAARTGKRRLLFMSRVHPKKGLLHLVEAWRRVRPAGWEVVVAGPDDGGHLDEVRRAIDRAGLDGEFRIVGEVSGADKWALYGSSDLFALPTLSENFGVVVAEAMASGLPVITTTAAPWESLRTHGCGWWIDVGAGPLAAALAEAVALDDEARIAMGARGRRLVEERFAWSAIAAELDAAYGWLLRRNEMPRSVLNEGVLAAFRGRSPVRVWAEEPA